MKRISFILALFITNLTFGQNNIKVAAIGAFKTEGGGIIKNCKIGYRTMGRLNSNKSNVILWLSWLTGTSNKFNKYYSFSNGYFRIIYHSRGCIKQWCIFLTVQYTKLSINQHS